MDEQPGDSDALSVFTTSAAHAVLVMYASHFTLLHRVDESSPGVLREAFPERFSGAHDAAVLDQLAQAAGGLLPAFERSGYVETNAERSSQAAPAWSVPDHAVDFLRHQLARYETPNVVSGAELTPRARILNALQKLARDTADAERLIGELAMQLRAAEAWSELELLWSRSGMRLIVVDPYAAHASYGSIPDRVLEAHPGLRFAHLYLETTSIMHGLRPGVSGEGADVLVARLSLQVTEITSALGPRWREFESADIRLHTGINWMRFQRLRGDFAGALSTLAELQRFFVSDVAAAHTVSDRNLAFFKLEQGILFFFVERWPEALESLREAVLLWQRPGNGDYVPAFALALSGMIHALRGSRAFATECLERAQQIFGEVWDLSYVSVLTISVEALLALDRLDVARAQELMEMLSGTAPESELWPIVAQVRQNSDLLSDDTVGAAGGASRIEGLAIGTGRLSPLALRMIGRLRVAGLLAQGNAQRARAYLQERPMGHPGTVHENWARLLLMAGRPTEALRHVDAVLNDDRVSGRERLGVRAIEAAAHLVLGDGPETDRAISALLTEMRHASSLVPLAVLPREIREDLIERCATKPDWAPALRELGLEPEQARRRLAALGEGFPESALLVDLTPREEELLQLLDARITQAEIAARLHLALSTVKKQVAGLYRKLGVESQAEAIRQAYRLGLLGG